MNNSPSSTSSSRYNLRRRNTRTSEISTLQIDDELETEILTKKESWDKKSPGSPKAESDFSGEENRYDSEEDYGATRKKLKKLKKAKSTVSNKRASSSAGRKPRGKKAAKEEEEELVSDEEEERVEIELPLVKEVPNYEEDLKLPKWLQPAYLTDKDGRRPDEEGYDPTTIHVPKEEFKKFPKYQQQYWNIKSQHFDKMVAFKFGVFYFFYFSDALIAHRLLDLKLNIYSQRYSSFFHETHLKNHASKLLEHGHKIVVVEQMESSQAKENETDAIKREVCQILTRGTYTDQPDPGYSPRFCLCLFEMGKNYGIVFLETTTHEFFLGEFVEDAHKGNLKTILSRLKPMEIVYISGNLSHETITICKNLSNKPTMNPLYNKEHTANLSDILKKVEGYFQDDWPETLESIRMVLESGLEKLKKIKHKEKRRESEVNLPYYNTLQALSVCLNFLEGVMLADTVFKMGNFFSYDIALEKKSTLYLDSQALESLEIFEVGYLLSKGEGNVGSLFDYMDRTVTDFGRRLMRRWIVCPLLDPDKIVERQDAVEDLVNNRDALELFQTSLRKLPDLERVVNKVYNLSNKKRMSAVYFEDFAKNRLRDFLEFLDELEAIDEMVTAFQEHKDSFKAKRLRQLIMFKSHTPFKEEIDEEEHKENLNPVNPAPIENGAVNNREQRVEPAAQPENRGENGNGRQGNEQEDQLLIEEEGVFPRIRGIILKLKKMVRISDGLPIPAKGIDKEVDEIIEEIGKIKTKLNIILENEKRYFGYGAIHYVHTRIRYQLEVPEELIKNNRPDTYAITSKRIGYLRFHTPKIEECIQDLEEAEAELQKRLIGFIVNYFKKFYDNNLIWRQVVSCLSELDCLCSLARLAHSMKVKCRPLVMKPAPADEANIFELRGMVHPSLAAQFDIKKHMEEIRLFKFMEPKDAKKARAKKRQRGSDSTTQSRSSNEGLRVSPERTPQPDGGAPLRSVSQILNRDFSQPANRNELERQVATQAVAPPSNQEGGEEEKKENFVRNDVVREEDVDVFLITGPNMGGKSTLLRQTALAVIMAQVGSMVPARSFWFTAVDRIFTRIGAGDKIMEGKSTFYLEMEETGNIVKEATKNSLLVIDELGRGTSTFDGVALAYGTLKYIAEHIKCTTLFATHYHILLEEFQVYKNVERYYMRSEYDQINEEVKFLYTFAKGQAERSHSFVVAKMAGLPAEMLKVAKDRAATMTKEQFNLEEAKSIQKKFNQDIKIMSLFRKKGAELDIEEFLEELDKVADL